MKRLRAARNRRRADQRIMLRLEALEDRTLLSISDGSFQDILLTNLRADPNYRDIDGHGVGIAIIDSGVYAQNPELQGNFVKWFDAINPSNAVPIDPLGHGTHVAGIAAATNPDIGVAPGASIIGIRALTGPDDAQPNQRDPIADALSWVAGNYQQYNIRVVNLSLGNETNLNSSNSRLNAAASLIAQLEGQGITVVAAAGNNYADFLAPGLSSPAVFATVAVSNVWATGGRFAPITSGGDDAKFLAVERESAKDLVQASSQRSDLQNQVAAPGQNIISTWNSSAQSHNTLSGTSMAAPMVSGAVALVQQAAYSYGGRYLSPSEVREFLRSTADSISDGNVASNGRVPVADGSVDWNSEGNLPETGLALKRINVYRAVQAVHDMFATLAGEGQDSNGLIDRSYLLPGLNGIGFVGIPGSIGFDGDSNVGANDVDLWQIPLDSPGSLKIDLNRVTGGTDFDTYLRLFDASGAEIAANNDRSGGDVYSSLTSEALEPGTYYVGVSSYQNTSYDIRTGAGAANGGSSGDYELMLSLSNPDPNGIIPGAVWYAGLPISDHGVIGSDPAYSGSETRIDIGPQDVDMYQVIAPDDGLVVVDTFTGEYGEDGVDAFVRVFDAQGQQIASSSGGAESHVSVHVTVGQLLYVAVSDAANTSYDPFDPYDREALGSGGEYDILIHFDNGDQNGTIETAQPTEIGDTFTADIGTDQQPGGGTITVGHDGSRDVDIYAYTPTTDGLLEITVTGQNGFIPTVSLWSQDGSPGLIFPVTDASLAQTDIVYYVQPDVTYFLIVTGLGNGDFLTYAPGSGSGGLTGRYVVTSTMRPFSYSYLLSNDDLQGEPTNLPGLDIGDTIIGNVGQDGSLVVGPTDIDLYRFVAPRTETIAIRTDTSSEGSSDTYLRFFDAAGHELGFNHAGTSTSTNSLLLMTVTAEQVYYVGVNGYSANARNYNPVTGADSARGSQGNYLLTVGEAPTSAITALSDFNSADFAVSWSGDAGAGGTAVARYDVFVSDNGSAFSPFMLGTSLTSVQFHGVTGHTYSFYSAAIDQSGNRQSPPSAAQATTRVDGAAPTSSVAELPQFRQEQFTVQWSGSDNGGSGIASFDVYVSENGAPFQPWLIGTTQSSAVYFGAPGRAYAFYSVAVDRLGNRQVPPALGSAATRVDATPPQSTVATLPEFSRDQFRMSWSGTDDAAGIATYDVYVSDNGAAFTPYIIGTTQQGALFNGESGHSYAFYTLAHDTAGNVQAVPSTGQTSTQVDATAPQSVVGTLPTGSPSRFVLNWTGSDLGSAVAAYDVYVSDNGSAFVPMLLGATQTSFTFQGEVGHRYGFYSLAIDQAGNRQATPSTAQAMTEIAGGIYVTGADAGGGPDIKVFDAATNQVKFNFFAYDPNFTGGVRVAVGDVSGDGFADVICAAGPGGGPNISVYDGKTGQRLPGPLGSFFAYDPRFTGGVHVAAGDVDGDSFADIICGADAGGGPNITVFSGQDGTRLLSFFAYDSRFTGGVRVAAGDVDGDGKADIIAGAGPGGGPQVTIFRGLDGSRLQAFFAFDQAFNSGIYIAAGDINGDGKADVITGAGAGGGPNVAIFNAADGAQLVSYLAYNQAFTGGVRVAAVDHNGDGKSRIITVAGPGGGPDVRSTDPATLKQIDDFFAYDPRFTGGLYVAGGNR